MADWSDMAAAARAVSNPATTPADLGEIARVHRGLWAQIAAHPQAYPQLLDWLAQHGDDAAREAVSARRATPAAPSAPPFVVDGAPAAAPAPATAAAWQPPVSQSPQPARAWQPVADAAGPAPHAGGPGQAPSTPHPRGRFNGRTFALGGLAGIVVAGLVALALALTGVIGVGRAGSGQRFEGPGFATPEAAAQAFLDGLKAKDLPSMLDAFAVESFAQQCDFGALLSRLKMYQYFNVTSSCGYPQDDPLGQAMNIAARRGTTVGQVSMLLAAHVSPHLDPTAGGQTFGDDPAEVTAFQAQTKADFANYLFAGMGAATAVSPDSVTNGKYSSDVNQRMLALTAAQYGLQSGDCADVVLTFDLRGERWVFAPSVGRYHGKWYILTLQGNVAVLLGMNATAGGMGPMPPS